MRPSAVVWSRFACILHASVSTTLWYAIVMLDKDLMPVRVWTAMTVLWALWIGAPVLAKRDERGAWIWTVVLGLAVLSPVFSTLYAFAVWTFGGFAP